MNWLTIALACAGFTALCDAVSKQIMKDNDEWLTGTVILGIGSVLLLPLFLSLELPPVTPELIVLLIVAWPLEIAAYYWFLSAIRMAPLSLTVPLLAFTPVFTLFISEITLNEAVSVQGGIGVMIVTLGAYLLNADLIRGHILAPIRALVSNPGSRRMLLVACIWSFTSALGKKGVMLYGPLPFGLVLMFGVCVSFTIISVVRLVTSQVKPVLKPQYVWLVPLGGLFIAGMEITHFVSISMAPVAYMISVKRLSLVFGVILGRLFFKEVNIRYRLLGAFVMVTGVFLISTHR